MPEQMPGQQLCNLGWTGFPDTSVKGGNCSRVRRCDAPTQRWLHRGTNPLLSLPAPFSLLAHSLFCPTLVLPRMFSLASHLSFPEVQRQVKPLYGSWQTDLFPAVATGTTCTKPLPRSTNGQMKGEQTPGASSFLRGPLGSSPRGVFWALASAADLEECVAGALRWPSILGTSRLPDSSEQAEWIPSLLLSGETPCYGNTIRRKLHAAKHGWLCLGP